VFLLLVVGGDFFAIFRDDFGFGFHNFRLGIGDGWSMVVGGETVRPGLAAHAKQISGDISVLPCYFFSPEGDFYVKK
jgi:hypothetical protein